MASVQREGEFGASVDEVWKVVSDFGGFLEAMGFPADVDGDGVGMTRTVAMGPSPTIERLEELDEDAKRLVYSILQSPIPVANYRSTMQLSPAGDGRSKLTWSSTFDVPGGATEEQGVQIVANIYEGGIGILQSRFGS